jgi:hypothetical protein
MQEGHEEIHVGEVQVDKLGHEVVIRKFIIGEISFDVFKFPLQH